MINSKYGDDVNICIVSCSLIMKQFSFFSASCFEKLKNILLDFNKISATINIAKVHKMRHINSVVHIKLFYISKIENINRENQVEQKSDLKETNAAE